MFKRIIVVFLTLTWVISSCSGSKDDTIKTTPKIAQDSISNVINNFNKSNHFISDFEKSKSEIKSFGDLAKNLNEYKFLWKSMGIDWDYANDAILSFKKWEDSGFLKTVDDKKILQVIADLPAECDLRGMVFDLWKESKKKN
jgi:hypothetical protein